MEARRWRDASGASGLMRVQVREIDLHLTDCETRIPFRFGNSTMTHAPLIVLRATIDTDTGMTTQGLSSDLLVPKWFEKNPDTSIAEDWLSLLASVRTACDAARGGTRGVSMSVFELWRHMDGACVRSGRARGLLESFGVSLVERAVIDAVCRAADISFFDALRGNLFEVEPGAVHDELSGWDLTSSLPTPLKSLTVRHTVGLVDPLRSSDLSQANLVSDGLPQALDEDIRHYGLSCFNIKLCGDRDQDLARLGTLAEIFAELVPAGLRVTVDGNEQFTDLGNLVRLFDDIAKNPATRPLVDAHGHAFGGTRENRRILPRSDIVTNAIYFAMRHA